MSRRVIQLKGVGPVEVFGETDDDPEVSFRPSRFVCSACGKVTPAVVVNRGKMKCIFCGHGVSLVRERMLKAAVASVVISSPIALLTTPRLVDDKVAASGTIGAIAFLIAALLVVGARGDRIVRKIARDFRHGSTSPKEWLLLFLLGITLHGLAAYIFLVQKSRPNQMPDRTALSVTPPALQEAHQ